MGIKVSTRREDDNSPKCLVCGRRTGIEGVPYCSRHKCGWPECNGKKIDSLFEAMCAKHSCAEKMCHESVVSDGTAYCSKHKCGWKECAAKAAFGTFIDPLCQKHKEKKEKREREKRLN